MVRNSKLRLAMFLSRVLDLFFQSDMKCDWLLNHIQTNESNHKNPFLQLTLFIYWLIDMETSLPADWIIYISIHMEIDSFDGFALHAVEVSKFGWIR